MARRVVGQVLREAREQAALSLRDLERLCGMTTSQLSPVETGRWADPAFSTVMRMADGIGVSLAEIGGAMRGAGKPEIRIDPGTRAAVETAARLEEAKRKLNGM
jgi:transcriptional regulator with XRE-family HTH domain